MTRRRRGSLGDRLSRGSAPTRRIVGSSPVQSTMVEAGPPSAGPPSSTRSIASPSCATMPAASARLRGAGDVRRGRRQRPDAASQGPRRVVVRHAQADRRAATGQGRRPSNVGALRDHDRQPAWPARGHEGGCGRRDRRRPGRLGRVVEQQHHGLVRRAAFHVEQSLDAAGRGERHRDAVDRVGRQRDDAAAAEHLDGQRPARRVVRHDPGGHADRLRRSSASAARRCDAASTSRGRRQDELLDDLRGPFVLERRCDVAGDRADLGRRARHRRAVADLGEHLQVVPLVADGQGRRRAGCAAAGPASERPGPSKRRAR